MSSVKCKTSGLKAYVQVTEALERWSIGRTKLYELISSGDIRAVKLGSRILVSVPHGDAFFASLPSVSHPAAAKPSAKIS